MSIVLFPIIISFGRSFCKNKNFDKKTKSPHNIDHTDTSPNIHPILSTLARWVEHRSAVIIVLFLIATALGIYGTSKVQVDLDAQKMTGTRLPHMKDIIEIGNSQIASNEILELIITIKDTYGLERETLQQLDQLEDKIETLELVKYTDSLATQIRNINYLNHANNAEFKTIPTDNTEYNILIDSVKNQSSELIEAWHNEENGTLRVSIELSDFSSKKINEHIDDISSFIEEIFPQGTRYFFSGPTYQMAVMNQYITKGLIRSLLTALITITIIMIIIFKNIKMGLIAMIPNVFPVIITGGIMGMLNIPLEFVTMTVAPLILGLAVDDTIHLIWHLKEDLIQRGNFSHSIRNTFSVVGKAITQTTCILCLTFLVFTFSQVNNIIYMGLILCSGLLAAYVSDILVTPILVKKAAIYDLK